MGDKCYYYTVGNWHIALFAISLRDAQKHMRQYRYCDRRFRGHVSCDGVPDFATGMLTAKFEERCRAYAQRLYEVTE